MAGARMLARTHCPRGHEYSGENLYVTPQGHRHCKECRRQNARYRLSIPANKRAAIERGRGYLQENRDEINARRRARARARRRVE